MEKLIDRIATGFRKLCISPEEQEILQILNNHSSSFKVDSDSISLVKNEYTKKRFAEEAQKVISSLSHD
ncbi:MAG: hypothetical protein NTW90_07745 [Nitrosospira sp.]|nr:hypothetical protein [Nitrosospira sp.]